MLHATCTLRRREEAARGGRIIERKEKLQWPPLTAIGFDDQSQIANHCQRVRHGVHSN